MSARNLFALDAVLVVVNLLCIAFMDGGVWNGIAAVVLTVFAVDNYRDWRTQVDTERRWTA